MQTFYLVESESEPESEENKDEKSSNVNEEVEPCSEDTCSQQRSTRDTERYYNFIM